MSFGDPGRGKHDWTPPEAESRELIKQALDYVDLYQIHRSDYETPIEETPEALDDVVRAGTRPWDAATARSETDDFGRSLYQDEAWVLANPAVTAPIVGATKPEHLADAIAAVDLELAEEDLAALEEPYRPHQIAGHV
jgi:aryl-alcohol dehydrogenase-like predicted oxidoreductase